MNNLNWFDLFARLDAFLMAMAQNHNEWLYLLLFAIIFLETALIFMAFLPGDSLLFVAGAIAAQGLINPFLLAVLLVVAGVMGNSFGYYIGAWFGRKIYDGSMGWIDADALAKTKAFYTRHGGKTLVLARFVPLVRSGAPMVAGAAGMDFRTFLYYTTTGGVFWVLSLGSAGYLFGQVPIIKDNLGIILIIGICSFLIPMIGAGIYRLIKKKRA